MMKTLAIAAVTTALMAAAPAQAIEAMNALTANAVSSNALTANAVSSNALTANAISSNALALRGSSVDGRIQVIAIELAEPIRAE
jgi:hypothetical protein